MPGFFCLSVCFVLFFFLQRKKPNLLCAKGPSTIFTLVGSLNTMGKVGTLKTASFFQGTQREMFGLPGKWFNG